VQHRERPAAPGKASDPRQTAIERAWNKVMTAAIPKPSKWHLGGVAEIFRTAKRQTCAFISFAENPPQPSTPRSPPRFAYPWRAQFVVTDQR